MSVSTDTTNATESIRLALGTYHNTIYGLQTKLPKLDLSIDNNEQDITDDANDHTDELDNNDSDTSSIDDNVINTTTATTENQFVTEFAMSSHLGSIKCITCDPTGEWMCSSGTK